MKLRTFVAAAATILGFVSPTLSHEYQYNVVLTGIAQAPSNASPGFGSAVVTLDLDIVNMRIEASFSGLLGAVTGADIHAVTETPLSGTAIVATQNPTLPAFPLGVMTGTYDETIDLTQESSYSPEFLAAHGPLLSNALNAFVFGIDAGRAYLNIRTTAFEDGEIRGFLVLPGDFNRDATVQAADYTVWRDSLGQTGSGLDADHNSDNIVDANDYALWLQNFGRTNPFFEEGGGSLAAVPEPTSIALLCIGLGAAPIGRRRR